MNSPRFYVFFCLFIVLKSKYTVIEHSIANTYYYIVNKSNASTLSSERYWRQSKFITKRNNTLEAPRMWGTLFYRAEPFDSEYFCDPNTIELRWRKS